MGISSVEHHHAYELLSQAALSFVIAQAVFTINTTRPHKRSSDLIANVYNVTLGLAQFVRRQDSNSLMMSVLRFCVDVYLTLWTG